MEIPNTNNPQPIDAELHEQSQQPVLHDLEVIARTVDMIPGQSDLGRYLAEPAKVIEKGEDGHSRAVDAGYSNLDRFKQGTEKALTDFNDGKVARIKLMGGMVNGHVDAHRGSGIANMRYAFEQLHHFGITGDSGFHSLLNRGGRTIGNLEYDAPDKSVSEQNEPLFAEGAAAILDGENSVMFNNTDGKPHDKLYGMTDPQTGERLKNAFLLVGGGTFSDKDGTASNFSNIAWAEVVLVPDQKIAEVKQAKEATQTEEKPAFDIDKVDWTPFQHSNFRVRRSPKPGEDAKFDEGGWSIKEVFQDDKGVYRARITGWDPSKGGGVHKDVKVEDLVSWQKQEK